VVEQWASAVGAEHGFSDIKHIVDLFGICGRCRAAK
jgi:Fur family ferric uptake transcriptional regulator